MVCYFMKSQFVVDSVQVGQVGIGIKKDGVFFLKNKNGDIITSRCDAKRFLKKGLKLGGNW